jgi:hypothetical protein
MGMMLLGFRVSYSSAMDACDVNYLNRLHLNQKLGQILIQTSWQSRPGTLHCGVSQISAIEQPSFQLTHML